MLEFQEFERALLVHGITPAGPIPSVCDPDGVYPYPSFVETSHRPSLKPHRFVMLENDRLRATICPDLGGKVYSLVEKRSGKETLFIPASIRPVRILPRFNFVPGGIEVSFPISHTPVQNEVVDFQLARLPDRLYVWCGERELHFGLQWTVEYSLGEGDAFLTQRTMLRNPTRGEHPWMSWSNAAVPARPDTEFHFPNGPVLSHADELKTIDWATEGPRRVEQLSRMTGFFWMAPDVGAFGAFTPSLGSGLYHVARLDLAPGIKLWSYGNGPHEIWGRAASLGDESYVEIQGGPIRDQSIKQWLRPGQDHCHVEHWFPTSAPLDIHSLPLPGPELLATTDVPWFDWPPRPEVRFWQNIMSAHEQRALARLPLPPAADQDWWAPSGMELGEALRWAAAGPGKSHQKSWLVQLGAWLAARGEIEEALEVLGRSEDDRARALAGRLHLRSRKDPRRAAKEFQSIHDATFALHPQVAVERDLALAAVGPETLEEREGLLAPLANAQDEWLIERRAALLLDQGKPEQARKLLESTNFQLIHQRYVRTELWTRVARALGIPTERPANWLGEDDLAQFGAYREHADS